MRRLLKERGLTQMGFAERARVSREQVIRWCKEGTDVASNTEWWEDFFHVEHGYFDEPHEARAATALIGEMSGFFKAQAPKADLFASVKEDGASLSLTDAEIMIEDTDRFGKLLKDADALTCSAPTSGKVTLKVVYAPSCLDASNRRKKK